jgi:hypothetical protein
MKGRMGESKIEGGQMEKLWEEEKNNSRRRKNMGEEEE